jgi:hypothetical protein
MKTKYWLCKREEIFFSFDSAMEMQLESGVICYFRVQCRPCSNPLPNLCQYQEHPGVVSFWWGEPPSLRFVAPSPARWDARPTENSY